MTSCQLYLISPPHIDDLDSFAATLDTALASAVGPAAAVPVFQLRLKPAGDADILAAAQRLLPVCHRHDCILLLNDRPDLAKKARADGVHLGQSDMALEEARDLLGEAASIGVTCHNSTHLALLAGEGGADYVAFGAFYPTTTKQTEHRATPEILAWWHHATTLPCVAIGGITPQNAAPLVAAGADFLAVSSAVWAHGDGPAAALREFAATLGQG